ncbi:MAG: hypothetical protein JHD02_04240 [Thermoleophilaceae bacterium]|nr:hypothetical protein [Thermoleophilaceae bacterium]
MSTRIVRSALLATVVTLIATCSLAPAASADDYLVGLWGAAQFAGFVESWQGDDPANLDANFGSSDSTQYTNDGYGCQKRWNELGMKVDLNTYGTDVDACEQGLFGRAQLTSSIWHTSNGIRPGSSAKKARKKSVARCSNKPLHYCGAKGYILSTHRSDCAAGRVPSVIARVRGSRVTSLIVFTTSCE